MKCPICGRGLKEGREDFYHSAGGVDFVYRLIDNKWVWICMICDKKREDKQ